MTASVEDYYDGSRTFAWLSAIIDVPIDQVNFLLTQFTALILAGVLRWFLSPAAVSAAIRHMFGLVIGLGLGYFCFGRVVLAIALIYLSCVHYHRQMYNYGSYTLDITGPLMVITQKVTSLGFSIHDGLVRREEDLSPIQRRQAVKKMPTALEYFSYVFHFQALMAGPVILYRDYMDFIEGHSFKEIKGVTDGSKTSIHPDQRGHDPSPTLSVLKKVVVSLLCAAMFVTFIPSYPIQRLKDNDFLENTTVFHKIWYMLVVAMLVRFKYYHAWIFSDAICNNSGLGFNGYDSNGEPKWDLFSNVDVCGFELSLNLKGSIESWNKGTNTWLRSIVYERVKRNKIVCTYALSALWHGFYPGYYLTFANGAFFTVVSRIGRRHIRPYFLGSKNKKFLYDALTFVVMRVLMPYMTFSFILLEFVASIRVYLYLYMFPHIIGLAIIVIAPRLPKVASQTETNNKKSLNNTPRELINGTARKAM
ncbi:lysophospholipid acyltransferase 6 isoform X2 [Calliopsis andreniformis]|uniref:lysophospholipid acyltransferase 6 isoform X2 n=1 Tax=Calliopsis andreniformis TaxID=337506 RepID=UPI003FCCC085